MGRWPSFVSSLFTIHRKSVHRSQITKNHINFKSSNLQITTMPFGFTISVPRTINMDEADRTHYQKLITKVPSYQLCIGCGSCTATCTAGQLTPFNIRRTHTLYSRGQQNQIRHGEHSVTDLDKCMLCGKCTLVCPRGVNTRRLIIEMRMFFS